MSGGIEGLAAYNNSPILLGQITSLTATVDLGTNVFFQWDFGDTQAGIDPIVDHVYSTAGVYAAEVTAMNPVNTQVVVTYVTVFEHLTIPPGGNTVVTSDGVVTLQTSPEITETLTITYTPQLSTTHSAGNFSFAGVPFHLEAHGEDGELITDLTHPITLTLSYDEDTLPLGMAEEDIELSRFDTGLNDWVVLPGLVDVDANTLTVVLDHLSEFALIGPRIDTLILLPLIFR